MDTPSTLPANIFSLLKIASVAVGTYGATHGWFPATSAGNFADTLLSILLIAVPIGMSWWKNRKTAAHLVEAAQAPAGAPPPPVPV